jgi:hypothetical protein
MVVSEMMKLITDMQHVGSVYDLPIGGGVTRVHAYYSQKVWILPSFVNIGYIKRNFS